MLIFEKIKQLIMKRIVLIFTAMLMVLSAKSQCQDSIYINGHTINAGVSGVNYVWYKGDVRVGFPNVIPGATGQTYSPTDFTSSYSLTTFSSSGTACNDTSIAVFIDTNCRAYFYPTQSTPGQVILVDSSYGAGGGMTFVWNFGDGNTAFTQYPTHTYATHGSYQVSLYIYDSLSGCSNFYHDTLTVDSSGILRAGFSVSVIKAGVASLTERNQLENITMFPNPATNSVNLNFGKVYDELFIQVVDITGKRVYSNTVSHKEKIEINTSKLVSGIYMVHLTSGNSSSMQKLIVE